MKEVLCMKRVLMSLFVILLLVVAGCGGDKGDQAIGEVNGVKITQAQFDQRYALNKDSYESQNGGIDEKDQELIKNLKDQTFNDLIIMELIRQDASKRGLTVSEKEVDESLNYIKQVKNQQEKDGYQKFLTKVGTDEKGIKEEIKITLLSSALVKEVTKDVNVTDEAVRKYYDENPSLFEQKGGIQIYHVLVKDEKTAQTVLKKAQAGEDFAALAKQYSQDPGSKNQGGDVGLPVNKDTNFVPEFKEAALALKPGEISPAPVKSDYGYHIIKAGKLIPASQQSFDEVKDQIRQNMEQDEKTRFFQQYLQDMKSKAKIEDYRK